MVMGPADDKYQRLVAMERLTTDGSNWLLWQATMLSILESRNLIKHMNGTAIKPQVPTAFLTHYTTSLQRQLRNMKCSEDDNLREH
jgi:hypothetical protein